MARGATTRWALVATAAIGLGLMGLAAAFVSLLSSKQWCAQSLGAGKYIADLTKEGDAVTLVGGCYGLLTLQIKSLATPFMITIGALALCLIVLVVVVMADARLQIQASKDGVSGNVSGANAAEGAQAATDAAQAVTDVISTEGKI